MKKICDICGASFETKSSTRIIVMTVVQIQQETRKHQKTILRKSVKLHGIKK